MRLIDVDRLRERLTENLDDLQMMKVKEAEEWRLVQVWRLIA